MQQSHDKQSISQNILIPFEQNRNRQMKRVIKNILHIYKEWECGLYWDYQNVFRVRINPKKQDQ